MRAKSGSKSLTVTRREAVSLCGAGALAILSRGSALAHSDSDQPIGIWTQLKNMPFAVQEIYPAAFRRAADDASLKPKAKGVLVNAGGIAPGEANNVTDAVTIYDPITDEWSSGTALPEPRHHIALVNHNGFLYAISGFARNSGGGWQMQSSLWRIEDLNADQWTVMASLPMPQSEAITASVGGGLHVVGGRAPAGSRNREWNDHIDTDRHWAYDAAANTWTPRRPLPTPRNSAAGAVVGDVLYVIGGRMVNDGNTPACEVYEPGSDRWQTIAPMPAPAQQEAPRGQGGLAAAAWQGKVYAFGGEWFGAGGGGVYAEVWEYDPREDKWRAVASMPRPRHGLGAVALSDGIYVCGGAARAGGDGASAVLDRFEI